MEPLVIVNHLDVEVGVEIGPNGLEFLVGNQVYTNKEPDVESLNRAVVFIDPLAFNRAHCDHVLRNVKYTQADGLVSAVLAEEFILQKYPVGSGDVVAQTEQVVITMEEYRQYRCHKTLMTFCEENLNGNMTAAYYASNYNLTMKVETPTGPVMVLGCGFTLSKKDGEYYFDESMITFGVEDKLKAGFVFLPYHTFKTLDSQLGTYLIKGSE